MVKTISKKANITCRSYKIIALAILFIFTYGYVAAVEKGQIVINSDVLSVEEDDVATFEGKVNLQHEDIFIIADKLKVFYDPDNLSKNSEEGAENIDKSNNTVKYMLAEGNVSLQKDDDIATSNKAFYDLKSGIIILESNVLLKNKSGVITGEKVIYNKNTQQTIIEKADEKSESRVSAYFNADITE